MAQRRAAASFEPRASASGFLEPFEDRHASTAAYIDYMRPRCVELARVLKKTGSFYYHCDWQPTAISARLARSWR
jgi:DNA modification methylase